ncbi:MAG: signal peptide peptidase SppA [Deltaproteobacteria bacterium]|nr:signal peptide peptidase SppA [Deltaproteobacteria bacterium]
MRLTPLKAPVALIALTAVVLTSGQAGAQNYYQRPTEGVVLPSPSVTETDDATAIAINPAAIGFLDSWSFTYVGAWVNTQDRLTGQGHGLFFAFPLGPIGLGVATEFLTPPEFVEDLQGLDDRARFSLGMAINIQRAVGIGLAYRTFFRYDLGDIDTLDLGLTVRPANQLALAFTVSDVNAPRVNYAATDNTLIPARAEDAPRRFNVGLTIRPLGNDRLALGGEMIYIYGDVKRVGRYDTFFTKRYTRTDFVAMLDVMLFDGLSLRARFGAEDAGESGSDENGYFIDGSLAIDFENFGLTAAPYYKIRPDDYQGLQGVSWKVRFSGDEAPALSIPSVLRPTHAVIIDIEKRHDSYGTAKLMHRFERIIDDDGVDMIVLRPDGGSLSLTQAREIRRRIGELQDRGGRAVCYLTEATAPVYFACAGADEVWMNPAGGARLTGLASQALFFKDLLDKVGVSADIVRIGEYKSAPEAFTRTGPSEPASQAINRFLDSVYDRVSRDLAADRDLADMDAAKRLIEDGPYTATEALAAGLVDRLVTNDKLSEELGELADGKLTVQDNYGEAPLKHRTYLDAPAVAVVHIDGDLIDGESVNIPFFGIKMTGAKSMTKTLRGLADDPRIHAVVLRIDSPGGSAVASDIIWHEVMSLKERKPVIASMGPVAASGGYYIASAADVIYAEPTTLTGSIGIFYGKADVSGLLDKVGIDVTTFKRGEHADMESWTRPYTPEERRKLLGQIRQYYNMFLDRVAEGRGRGFNREIVDKRGRGRIWSGADAKYHLLVDELGGYLEAVNHARSLGNVGKGTRVFHVPENDGGLLKMLIKSMRSAIDEPSPLDAFLSRADIKSALKAALPFAAVEPGAPQARLPFAIVEP